MVIVGRFWYARHEAYKRRQRVRGIGGAVAHGLLMGMVRATRL